MPVPSHPAKPTNPTIAHDGSQRNPPSTTSTGFRQWTQKISDVHMENLSGRTVERAAHLEHLAACVDSRQQAVLAQPMPEGLLT
jgi:hypothetical protein